MSASASPPKLVILEQLQSDAPWSPLVGHLINRLGGADSLASPIISGKGVGDRAAHTIHADGHERSILGPGSGSPRPLVQGPEPPPADEATTMPKELSVKIYSPKSVSTDSFIPSSSSGGDRGANASHSSVEERQEKSDSNDAPSISNDDTHSGGARKLESYVLVHNVAKRHNLGMLARSASAFGVTEVILVGRKDFNAFGSHGASLHLQFRHFHTLSEAALYLKAKEVDICGVEIVEAAKPVHKHPFNRSTAFVLGNEGMGLSKKEMDICSFFVYIPQCGSGTASLNVTVAASIVLHHFSVWAGFAETGREGQKFVVAQRPVRRTPRNVVEDPDAVQERRRSKAVDGPDDWLLCDGDEENDVNSRSTGGPDADAFTVKFPPAREKSGFLSTLSALYS